MLRNSRTAGNINESVGMTLPAGTYYIRTEAQEKGKNLFNLRYGVEPAEIGVGPDEPDLPGWYVVGSGMLEIGGALLTGEQIASVTRTLTLCPSGDASHQSLGRTWTGSR